MQKCHICQSDNTQHIQTIMLNEDDGYETYTCINCNGQFDLGIKIKKLIYTGIDQIFPFEKE